jgi:hypothetical protein
MRTLLSEQYAPITSQIGFVRAGKPETVDALVRWRRELGDDVAPTREVGDFPEALLSLPPLVSPILWRELLVATTGPWTAYFNCAVDGTDAASAIAVLSERLGCQGLVVTCQPHLPARDRMGAVMFTLEDPSVDGSVGPRRSIAAIYDGDRWRFDTDGEPLPFEERDRYAARRLRDRFTSDMLERYCRALGVDAFNGRFYRGPAVLVSHTPPTETRAQHLARFPIPAGAKGVAPARDPDELLVPRDLVARSLAEAQQFLGIVPGEADDLPG